MAIDEQKKAQIILSDEVAELSESQIEDLRGSAGSLVTLLSADPPPAQDGLKSPEKHAQGSAPAQRLGNSHAGR